MHRTLAAPYWRDVALYSTITLFFVFVTEGETACMYRDVGRRYVLPSWHDLLRTARIDSDPPQNGLHWHRHIYNPSPANLATCGEGERAYGRSILRH